MNDGERRTAAGGEALAGIGAVGIGATGAAGCPAAGADAASFVSRGGVSLPLPLFQNLNIAPSLLCTRHPV
ncbi:MAG: hypothetical protein KGP27_04760 [Hyphomicrobiales bacterium]|nr:hypothetical protein [Hyphomicrobiales bacterium]